MQSLWMVASAAFFGLYGVCVRFASYEGLGPMEMLLYRSALGMIVFYAVMRARGVPVATSVPGAHAMRCLSGIAAMLLGIYSMSHLNLGLATTLNYTAPLFLGSFSLALAVKRGRPVNWGLMAMILAGFAGVLVMLGPTLTPDEYFAAGVGLSAGALAAVATGYVTRLGLLGEPGLRIIFWLMAAGTAAGLAGIAVTQRFAWWTPRIALIAAGLGVSAILAQIFLTRAFRAGNMVLSSALSYTVVIFATVNSVLVFHERATPLMIAGMGVIVASSILATVFTRRAMKREKEAAGAGRGA
ncbi:MAG: DMT family transporter [Duodenibacillus sp.]|nr:DMT family transporter [Duodenibacillus sp.]